MAASRPVRAWTAAAGLTLAAALPGQDLLVGDAPPPLAIIQWVEGPRVELPGADAPEIVVVDIWPEADRISRARCAALSFLGQRFSDRVRIVGVCNDSPSEVERAVLRLGPSVTFSVARDRRGTTMGSYIVGAGMRSPPVSFVVARGRLAWIGRRTDDLGDVLGELCADAYDLEFAIARAERRAALDRAVGDKDTAVMLSIAEELRQLRPDHAWPHTLELRTLRRYGAPDDDAAEAYEEALAALSDDPAQLGAYVYDAVMPSGTFGAARREALRDLLGNANLRPPRHRKLFAAQFWILSELSPQEATGSAALWLECVKGDPGQCLDVAQALSSRGADTPYLHLAVQAVDLAVRADPEAREAHLIRFELLAHQMEDLAGARESGTKLVKLTSHDAAWLNSFAWGLLTTPANKGRFNELALFAAEAMTEIPGWKVYHRLDTLALAKFENGFIDEAIKLQREALESCSSSDEPQYRERLQHYQQAREERDGK